MTPLSISGDSKLARDRRGMLFVVAAIVASRVIYYLLGVRFDMTPLGKFDQILDPVLLRTNLLQSLWYLHSQPPAFNLGLGIVLKLFPGYEGIAFHASWILMGLAG